VLDKGRLSPEVRVALSEQGALPLRPAALNAAASSVAVTVWPADCRASVSAVMAGSMEGWR
jgi:hypothetical protein